MLGHGAVSARSRDRRGEFMSLQYRGQIRALAAVIVCAFGGAVEAETPAADDSQMEVTFADSARTEVVVTGSRIKRATRDTLEPAIVVTSDDVAERGLTNVADALN
jgi:outer membrane receptor protein involved in Fe transport